MNQREAQRTGEKAMNSGVKHCAKSRTFLGIGLISVLIFASCVEMRAQVVAASNAVSTSPQGLVGQSQTLMTDGRVLLTGGQESGAAVNTALFQNTAAGAQTPASGTLLNARAYHSATLLPSGSVFIFGGAGDGNIVVTQAELFDPSSQIFTNYSTNGLTPRSHHTATLLTDGNVLLAGGLDSQGNTLSQIDVWNYRTGQASTLTVTLKTPRSGHTATLMPDGTVLLWGGQDANGNPLNNGEIIYPNGPSVRLIGSVPQLLQYSEPPILAASIPQSGETGIPIDQIIALRFSKPMDVTSLNASTITLSTSEGGAITIAVVPAEGGMLSFITPQDSLQNGTAYTLTMSGATDSSGNVLPDTSLTFTTAIISDSGVATGASSSSASDAAASSADAVANPSATGLSSNWRKLPALQAAPGVTALAGQVLTLNGSPLANVLIEIDTQQATTDKTGRFLVQDVGSGHHVMIVDGGTANSSSNTYGIYRVGVDLQPSLTNTLKYTVWMTALDTGHVVQIDSPTTSDMVITNPGVPGLELHLPAGTVIHDARGNVVTQIGITPIPMNQPPFPLKLGVQFPVYFTIQPGGATFSNAGKTWSPSITNKAQGATIHYQNQYKGKPGARFDFWNYDPTQKGWYVYGHGRVSADRKMIHPEPGTQIYSFDGAMVSLPTGAPPDGPNPDNPDDGEPVDLQTGLFVYSKTDLVLNDVIPLSLTRTYRPGDSISRSFGIGTTMNYDVFMVGDALETVEGYTYQDFIQADGGRIHFTRTSPCLDGYCGYENAVYVATSTPGPFYGATLQYVPGRDTWTITRKDGTFYTFPDSFDASNPRQAALEEMNDRYGNTLTFTRSNSNLVKITSPNGRWIQFSYDSSNRVTQAQDSIGRSTSYTYNQAGYLATATDAMGGVTTYTYDSNGNMLTITDPRGITYLQNQYDANNMVVQQTQADGSIYKFAYVLGANGTSTQTTVTDPRGSKRKVTFNSDGYMTSDIHAVGMPEQQTITYKRQQGTGILLSTTDALSRTTTYSYDAMANVTTVTRLAGTSNAVTTTMAYDPHFYELSATTDPLGNTTTLSYDSSGNLVATTDPLGDAKTYTYNAAGQPLTVIDAQGNQIQFNYDSGNLVSGTDALGRTVSRFVDGAGRVASSTDPLGHTTRTSYDAASQVLSTIDPLGNQTLFSYDGNGNLLTLTDANQHKTTYAYDIMNRVISRTDPLGNTVSAQYDLSGKMTQSTDRKMQVTNTLYDALSRPTTIKFADGSTITYSYDSGNRVTAVTDSLTGRITRTYDDLDHLLTETTPQGFVSYTYDVVGRRQTMTVAGQATVIYNYDNANRLTEITQGTANVLFAYDGDGRRTTLTLPNGVTASYSYDAASQLTGINYQGGSMTPQTLTYSYDLAGRRVGVGGTLASTQLPTAVSSATYNANNQLTQWDSTAMTYDANGNTLNDGMNSYVWDARNRLVSADNGGARFSYDPLGRRVSKTVLSTTTNFLYDGANAVQEFGTLPTANFLSGGVDERFQRTSATETDDYLTDALGSTVMLMDATGNSLAQYSYAPFGSPSETGATTSNSYTYTGRESDGLGIDYYRARYYNPATGRFISEDPTGLAGGINLYAYAADSPTNSIDPSGLRWIVITVWNQQGSSVGHAAAWETNGNMILSSFPQNGMPKGQQENLNWQQTLAAENRAPDGDYLVWVPDDNAFDAEAARERNMPTWDWDPNNTNQTNCVNAVTRSLNAGGRPAPTFTWPGNFGDWLWNNQGPGIWPLPNVPWQGGMPINPSTGELGNTGLAYGHN